jgi:hypothetical protein
MKTQEEKELWQKCNRLRQELADRGVTVRFCPNTHVKARIYLLELELKKLSAQRIA